MGQCESHHQNLATRTKHSRLSTYWSCTQQRKGRRCFFAQSRSRGMNVEICVASLRTCNSICDAKSARSADVHFGLCAHRITDRVSARLHRPSRDPCRVRNFIDTQLSRRDKAPSTFHQPSGYESAFAVAAFRTSKLGIDRLQQLVTRRELAARPPPGRALLYLLPQQETRFFLQPLTEEIRLQKSPYFVPLGKVQTLAERA